MLAKTGSAGLYDIKKHRLTFIYTMFAKRKTDGIIMEFYNNKLFRAMVMFPPPDESEVLYQYNSMVKELGSVYGDGNDDTTFQYPFAKDDGHEVLAIKSDKADYSTTWYSKNAQGDDNTINIHINKDLSITLDYVDGTADKIMSEKESKEKAKDY